MEVIAIIPARMGSSRFPGKPMQKILGIPMIGHCYKRAKMCKSLSEVYVATCDKEIDEYIKSIGGKSIITSKSHERATDRTAEAMIKIEKKTGLKIEIIVMIQGDEPMITPKMIEDSIKAFKDQNINVVNLMSKINSKKEFYDPNEVKVVCERNNFALYFSREPIPSFSKYGKHNFMMKQVCIIPFRRNFLIRFNKMKETQLEKIESVDMLRILENGIKVKMVETQEETYSVDTKQDLNKVKIKMKADSLLKKY